MKKPLNTYVIIVHVVVHLTIKGGKDNTGFVLLLKWCFPQALRYYDYLHDSLFVLLAFAESRALYSHSDIWHRDKVSSKESKFKQRDG